MQINVKDLSLYQLKELDFALEEYIFKELGDEPFAPTYRKDTKEFRKLIRELIAFKRDLMKLFTQMYEQRHFLVKFNHIRADEYENYLYSDYWDDYDRQMAQVIETHTKKSYELGILSLLLAMGIATNLTADDAQHELLKHAIKISKAINKTTKDRIIKQIKASIALNEDRAAFEQRLKKVLLNQYRSYLIAENEGLQAYVDARQAVAEEKGFTYKIWTGVQTDPNEECGAVIGEVVPVDEPFSNGRDGPLLHIRCRCGLEYSNSK